ncbi:MAG TPA: ring-cleaving dioxygenase [Chloroflexota bacterium]|nr:ring-cleaving dioxygenase [Chloroflexota bacterium]
MKLGGLHHVTAVTSDASRNLAFYTNVLGMRLVKRTVNQDDVSAYHLFYGDEIGRAGTEMTFFDWAPAGPHRAAAGMVGATAFRVPNRAALDRWAARLDAHGVRHTGIVDRAGRAVLGFADPEGQQLELVDDSGSAAGQGVTPGVPWSGSPVDPSWGIRGLEGVTLTLKNLAQTEAVLTEVMGFTKVGEYKEGGHRGATFEVGPGGPGAEVRLVERPDLPVGRQAGAGGVHHVAFRTPNDEEHAAWRERLARAGLGVTPIIDRFYFHSIYFREPGGVLFEIATDGPGFATDEDVNHLGEALALPPFLEPRRAEIERGLKPIQSLSAAR